MYYIVDMFDDKMNIIKNIPHEDCHCIADAAQKTEKLLELFQLGSCVRDALDSIIIWRNNANPSGNFILRNLHTAERLVRSFLFEFRTCLDHYETTLKRCWGQESEIFKLFKKSVSNAYDQHPEYAFTYQLRNCSQHCNNIVHGFNGKGILGFSSSKAQLLKEYKKWKKQEMDYVQSCPDHIDLLPAFQIAFSALSNALTPVIQYLLKENNTCEELLYLNRWGDHFVKQYGHDIHVFHVFDFQHRDGTSATDDELDSCSDIMPSLSVCVYRATLVIGSIRINGDARR